LPSFPLPLAFSQPSWNSFPAAPADSVLSFFICFFFLFFFPPPCTRKILQGTVLFPLFLPIFLFLPWFVLLTICNCHVRFGVPSFLFLVLPFPPRWAENAHKPIVYVMGFFPFPPTPLSCVLSIRPSSPFLFKPNPTFLCRTGPCPSYVADPSECQMNRFDFSFFVICTLQVSKNSLLSSDAAWFLPGVQVSVEVTPVGFPPPPLSTFFAYLTSDCFPAGATHLIPGLFLSSTLDYFPFFFVPRDF